MGWSLDARAQATGVTLVGDGFIHSPLPVSHLATASFTALARALAELLRQLGMDAAPQIRVDRALCDAWFGQHVRAVGWALPSPWDPLSGAFATGDGSWIRTHANAPRHRRALLAVLGCEPGAEPDAVSRAIGSWHAVALEEAIVAAGGVAAAIRRPGRWRESAPGESVAREPLIADAPGSAGEAGTRWAPTADRPLAGVRVLDLTRVIAGPACTQVLAGLGADLLRIDPPDWDEPAVLPLVMWGKRSARLDATTAAGRDRLLLLLSGADVLVHGYRAGVIERLGLTAEERHRLRPGLIEVGERAYGWDGPWAHRRGFDSVVQFATGVAHAGMTGSGATGPVSLPVQALDWATGYLAATAAIRGLTQRAVTGLGSSWRLSLARTARELLLLPASVHTASHATLPSDLDGRPFATAHGDLVLASSPIRVGSTGLSFRHLATELGLDDARWL